MALYEATKTDGGFDFPTKPTVGRVPDGQRQPTTSNCTKLALAVVGLIAAPVLWSPPPRDGCDPPSIQGQPSSVERQFSKCQLAQILTDCLFVYVALGGPSFFRTLTGRGPSQHQGSGGQQYGVGYNDIEPFVGGNVAEDQGRRHRSNKSGKDRERGKKPSGGGGSRTSQPGTSEAELACPFFKFDCITYRKCGSARLRHVADVRQHVLRTHPPQALHCAICKREFSNDANGRYQRDAHMQPRNCIPNEIEVPGITEGQVDLINDPTTRPGTWRKNWYHLWDILFPNHAHPNSPFITFDFDKKLADRVNNYWDYVRTCSIPIETAQFIRGILDELLFFSATRVDATPRALTQTQEPPMSPAHPTHDDPSGWQQQSSTISQPNPLGGFYPGHVAQPYGSLYEPYPAATPQGSYYQGDDTEAPNIESSVPTLSNARSSRGLPMNRLQQRERIEGDDGSNEGYPMSYPRFGR
ncbi:hypothetical protein G7Z17_g4679 [Cylindrodendrum hubeiense]|uniref:C2H2-type domain-containing protein n=1 Tax=Cylindrodendrum hubeiense TaxID=595255 RepID=A0A9P5HGG0_9HYPO|nr:hypothetical protein G7Z17_g4679 [Cylindrodendrum hubeiense]